MAITVQKIHLSDIRAKYKDDQSGMDAHAKIGGLKVSMDEFDLDKMNFSVASATLDDTHFEYILTQELPASESAGSDILPQLALNNIKIQNLSGLYHSDPDDLHTDFDIHSDRKSTRLNSSHVAISYAVFCLKKKTRLKITL